MRRLCVTLFLGVPALDTTVLLRIATIKLVKEHTQFMAVTPAPIATVVMDYGPQYSLFFLTYIQLIS